MKWVKFTIILLLSLIADLAFTQQILNFSLKITNLEGESIPFQNVYLCIKDSIFSQTRTSNDGIATFYLIEKSNFDEAKVTIRQNDSMISRVSLKHLLDYDSILCMSNMKVSIVENHLLTEDVYEKKTLKPFDNTVSGNSIRMMDGFSKRELHKQFGKVLWYFPTDLFLHPKELFYNYVRNEYQDGYAAFEICEDGLNHYPTDKEVDSLAQLIAYKNAEIHEGLYCHILMRLCEPVLCNDYSKEVYRLTWFNKDYIYVYDTYSMRIEIDEYGHAIMYVSYQYVDDCIESTLYCDVIPLKDEQLQHFKGLLDLLDFWNCEVGANPDEGTYRKDTFVLEGYNDLYHVIFRDTNKDAILNEINHYLWGLTGLGQNKLFKSNKIE